MDTKRATSVVTTYVVKEAFDKEKRLSKIKDKMVLRMAKLLSACIDCNACPFKEDCEGVDNHTHCRATMLHFLEKEAKEEQEIEDQRYQVL